MINKIIIAIALAGFPSLALDNATYNTSWRDHESPQLIEWIEDTSGFTQIRELTLPQKLQLQGSNRHSIRHSPNKRFLVITDAYSNDRFLEQFEGNRAIVDRGQWKVQLLGEKAPFYHALGGSIDYSINSELYDLEPIYGLSNTGFFHQDYFISYGGELSPREQYDKKKPYEIDRANPSDSTHGQHLISHTYLRNDDGQYQDLLTCRKSGIHNRHIRPDKKYYYFRAIDRTNLSQLYWNPPPLERESSHYQMKLSRWGEISAQTIPLPCLEKLCFHPHELQIHDTQLYIAAKDALFIIDLNSNKHQSIPWAEKLSSMNEDEVYRACTVFPSGNVVAIKQRQDAESHHIFSEIIIFKKGVILHKIQHQLLTAAPFRLMDLKNRLRPQRVDNYLCLVEDIQNKTGEVRYRFFNCTDAHLGKSELLQTKRFCAFYHTLLDGRLLGILESKPIK